VVGNDDRDTFVLRLRDRGRVLESLRFGRILFVGGPSSSNSQCRSGVRIRRLENRPLEKAFHVYVSLAHRSTRRSAQ
jgi:hypothetical protein